VTTRVFSDEELSSQPGFREFVDPGRGRGPGDRLGLAVQLCTLPWLGFVPDDVASAPPAAVARLAERLQVPMDELRLYGEREQTRTDHLRSVASYLGWRLAGPLEPENLVGVVRGQPADRLTQGDPDREGRQRLGRADGSSRPAGLLPPRPPLVAAMPNL
jgi:hypothetical protein